MNAPNKLELIPGKLYRTIDFRYWLTKDNLVGSMSNHIPPNSILMFLCFEKSLFSLNCKVIFLYGGTVVYKLNSEIWVELALPKLIEKI